MLAASIDQIQISKASGSLGAFVTGVSLKDIVTSDAICRAVRGLLVQHEVLFFRDQEQTPSVFAAFDELEVFLALRERREVVADSRPDITVADVVAAQQLLRCA